MTFLTGLIWRIQSICKSDLLKHQSASLWCCLKNNTGGKTDKIMWQDGSISTPSRLDQRVFLIAGNVHVCFHSLKDMYLAGQFYEGETWQRLISITVLICTPYVFVSQMEHTEQIDCMFHSVGLNQILKNYTTDFVLPELLQLILTPCPFRFIEKSQRYQSTFWF